MTEHLLAIFPHPDDESFSSAGTIIQHKQQNIPVTYICGTLGEMGRSLGDPPFATRESLPLIREDELEQACQTMGIDHLIKLGLRDKTVEFENREELVTRLLDYIQSIQPSLILTFYPGYSVHPDHNAMGAAVIEAVRRLPENERPTVHCVAFSNDCEDALGPPDVKRDVRDVIDQKIKTLQCHRSQIENFRDNLAQKLIDKEPKTMAWLQTERFWTYHL